MIGGFDMCEKKPVYHGYKELCLSGSELKDAFAEKYLTTGRHHSIVVGISIPEYFELIGIKDTGKYRIFVNVHFCKIMDAETDAQIDFFGHVALKNVGAKVDAVKMQTQCSKCGAKMKFRKGKYGVFLGCSNYPKCRNTASVPVINQ